MIAAGTAEREAIQNVVDSRLVTDGNFPVHADGVAGALAFDLVGRFAP